MQIGAVIFKPEALVLIFRVKADEVFLDVLKGLIAVVEIPSSYLRVNGWQSFGSPSQNSIVLVADKSNSRENRILLLSLAS